MSEMEELTREYNEHRRQLEEEGVEFRTVTYEYIGKDKTFDLVVIPFKQIATVTRKTPLGDGTFELEIEKQGMNYDEICHYFPPIPALKKKGYSYNMLALFRSILYEMYKAVQDSGIARKEGNVRGVWYSHFIHVTESILGLGETPSVQNAINSAWEDMIVSGLFTYEDLGIISAKENVRESRVRDSPFNNIIVAVEKEDLFGGFRWIPRLFNCTLIAAGGQPSRAVGRAFIRQLLDEGVDLNQQFEMCTVSDCDPAGYYIQESFRNQLEKAIEYYGGTGKIDIHRMFVRKDQVTSNLLDHDGVPCKDKTATEGAAKAEDTKWENFCDMTNGGLYKKPPATWDGPTYDVDGEMKVRAKLELNAFGKDNIEAAIVREILKLIEDHSKIMIPEIMRILNDLKNEVANDRYKTMEEDEIQPTIDSYLNEIDKLRRDYNYEIYDALETADKEFELQTADITEEFQNDTEEMQDDIADKVRKEMDEYCKLEDEIKRLLELQQELEDKMFNKVDDELDDISNREDKYDKDMQPYEETRDDEKERLQNMMEMYDLESARFKNECSTVFGPAKEQLRKEILGAYQDIDIRFKDIEQDDDIKPHIARLLQDPDILLDDGISCFKQPTPTFLDTTSLVKAAKNEEENIGQHRDAFTPEFTDSMETLIETKGNDIQFEVKKSLLEVTQIDENKLEEFDQEARKKIEDEHGSI